MRTALVLPVPEVEAAVAALRLAHDLSAAQGMPAHVTVLFPFRPSELVDAACLEMLEELFEGASPFPLAFSGFGRFADTLWLAPEPAEPIRRLTEKVARAFPECPPYGGAFADIVPHLTVGQADASTLDGMEIALAPALVPPIEASIDACSLFVHRPAGWRETERFRLGAARSSLTPP